MRVRVMAQDAVQFNMLKHYKVSGVMKNVKVLKMKVRVKVMQSMYNAMQSKEGVRPSAQSSYDDEKRPSGFVYSLQWPLNEAGGGN